MLTKAMGKAWLKLGSLPEGEHQEFLDIIKFNGLTLLLQKLRGQVYGKWLQMPLPLGVLSLSKICHAPYKSISQHHLHRLSKSYSL
jgi:hypothetical protein